MRLLAEFFVSLLVLGVSGVWKGQVRASKDLVVLGTPARIIGWLFVSTLPLASLAYWLAQTQRPGWEPLIAFFLTLLGCAVAGAVIGFRFRTPRYPQGRPGPRDRFPCPGCGEDSGAAAAAEQGGTARCVRCGRIFMVPGASGGAAPGKGQGRKGE
jgi:hypothetical protein